MESLGSYIGKLRIKQGYSAGEFGRLIQMPAEDIWKVERGCMLLSRWQLLQIAALLKTNGTTLLMALQNQLIRYADKAGISESTRPMALREQWQQWQKMPPEINLIPHSNEMGCFLESMVYHACHRSLFSQERIMPEGRARLVIDIDQSSAILIGPSNRFRDIRHTEKSRQIIIRFQPYGLYPLTGIPQQQLLNRVVDASCVFGDAIHELYTALAVDQNLDAMRGCLQWFFQDKMPRSYRPSVPEQVVRYVVDHIDQPVAQLVKKSGYSAKHLIDLVKNHTGYTPKGLQQVMQFSRALQELSLLPTYHTSDLGWNAYYCDLPHIIKQFRRFSGLTPSAYLQTGNICSRRVLL